MLDHLIGHTPEIEDADTAAEVFEPIKRIPPNKLLNAQQATSSWLAELGAPGDDTVVEQAQREAAREAYAALATSEDTQKQREALLKLKAPSAISHLNAMLEAHDWEFVERAKELRSFAVTKIIKETEHHDARIRLRALELLGKVTEVGLFTERVEIKKVEVGDTELEARIREKLERLMISNGQLEDVQVKEPQQEQENEHTGFLEATELPQIDLEPQAGEGIGHDA
jgi:hypothetical protein